MNIIGVGSSGDNPTALAADTLLVTPEHAVSDTVLVPKLSAYLDGLAGGDQPVKGVIYSDGELVATSAATLIPTNAAEGWVDLSFTDAGGVRLDAGDYQLGLHAGPGDSIRFYNLDDAGSTLYADTYSDGAMTPLVGGAAADTPALFATYFQPWLPPTQPDLQLARLAFPAAQDALSDGLGVTARYTGVCGWHGTRLNKEFGSIAIVQRDGPLSGLLGERVRIKYGDKCVVAYVLTREDVYEEITVTRRLYMELTPPAVDELDVEIEVLG